MVGLNLSDSFASSSTSSLGCGRVRGRRSTSIDYDGSINTTSSAVAQRRRRHPAEVSTNSSSTSSSSKNSSRFLPMKGPGYLALVVVVVIITLQFTTSPVLSASLNKRSTDQSEDVCRTNAICGWEVYHPSTRNLQYYVASSCKCQSPKESCIRSEDDISISAYVFRCRDHRRRKGSRRPSAMITADVDSETSSS